MQFNTIDFAFFLPIVFLLYWFVTSKSIRIQNVFLIIASYTFYGWWDWRFLFLILLSTVVDFCVGVGFKKYNDSAKRRLLLIISVCTNLGLLGFFKYYNFFIESAIDVFTFFGNELNFRSLQIILPVGISFYTFQTLSYSIDVYKGKLQPTTDFFSFAAFVSFFPQLVAGPIERATHFLPQFQKKRHFEYTVGIDGLKQILWGLFKKVVIADNCAYYVDIVFANSSEYTSSSLIVGAILFSFQIYADFSGYSDIAIGVSKLFGFHLKQNFAYPYFSTSIVDFWRRWHISLSTWFRDYLYIPLGGNKGSYFNFIRNIFLVFTISGLWHGASWTFVAWGSLHAVIYLITYYFIKKERLLSSKINGSSVFFTNMIYYLKLLLTFFIVCLTWVFFRSETIGEALTYLTNIFSSSILSFPNFMNKGQLLSIVLLVLFFVCVEWIGKKDSYALKRIMIRSPRIMRWSFYSLLILLLGVFAKTQEVPFIYFQF